MLACEPSVKEIEKEHDRDHCWEDRREIWGAITLTAWLGKA